MKVSAASSNQSGITQENSSFVRYCKSSSDLYKELFGFNNSKKEDSSSKSVFALGSTQLFIILCMRFPNLIKYRKTVILPFFAMQLGFIHYGDEYFKNANCNDFLNNIKKSLNQKYDDFYKNFSKTLQ